jgi:hypothetical protein
LALEEDKTNTKSFVTVRYSNYDDEMKSTSWARHVARTGDMRNEQHTLLRKCEGNRELGTGKPKRESNIKLKL